MTTERWLRAGLVVLALGEAPVGVWATLAPASWYEGFPGGGRHWLPPLGAYNEHLARDVGALTLGLLAVTIWATVSLERGVVLAAMAGWIVAGVPHLVYHLGQLHLYAAGDNLANTVALSLAVVLPAALMVLALRQPAGGGAHEAVAA